MHRLSCRAVQLAALLAVIGTGGMVTRAQAAGAVRVAIVGGTASAGRGEQADAVTALMQAQGVPEVQFVERAAINKVLGEQQLSASALVSPDAAVKIGRLVGADVLVVVELAGDAKATALGVVIFDVGSGVRLGDGDLSAGRTPEESAKDALAALASAVRKRGNPTSTRTLALLAVRNVNLPPELEGLCSTVSLLVQRGLLASPDVAVLERQRLENVNVENSLPTAGGAASTLLTTVQTVDLQLTRNPDKSLSVKATLRDPQHNAVGDLTVQVPAGDAAAVELSAKTVAGLLDKVRATPVPARAAPLDPKREAQRYAIEAEAALRNKELYRALGAAEAAYALDAYSDTNLALLTLQLAMAARERVMPGKMDWSWTITNGPAGGEGVAQRVNEMPAMFSIGLRALSLRKTGFERWVKSRRSLSAFDVNYLQADRHLSDLLQARYYEKEPAVRESSLAYRRQYWDLVQEVLKDRLEGLKSSKAGTVGFSVGPDFWYLGLNCSADTANDYVDAILPVIEAYWEYEKFGHAGQGRTLAQEAGTMTQILIDFPDGLRHWTYPDYGEASRKKIDGFLARLESDPDEGVKTAVLTSRKEIAQFLEPGKVSANADEAAYLKVRDQFKASLVKPSAGATDVSRQREEIYGQWFNMLTSTRFTPQSGGYSTQLLDYLQTMIDRREVTPHLFGNVFPTQPIKVDKPELLAHALRQLVEITRDPKTVPLTGTRSGVMIQLQKNALALQRGSYPAGTPLKSLPEDLRVLIDADHPVVRLANFGPEGPVEGALLAENRLYQLAFNGNSYILYASDITPDARVEKVGSIAVDGAPPTGAQELQLCIDGGMLYAGCKFGVLAFPLDRSARPSLITTAQGLPANAVRSVAPLDGKLIVGYGTLWGDDTKGGYLARYDPATKQCELLASTQRVDGTAPLEGHGQFRIETLIADPARRRVIMSVFFEMVPKPKEAPEFKQGISGIYAMNADGTISLISPVGQAYSIELEILSHSLVRLDRVLLVGRDIVLAMDLKTDKLSAIYDGYKFDKPRSITPTLSGKDALFQGYMETSTSAAYCLTGDAFWVGSPLMEIPLATRLPILKADDSSRGSALLLEELPDRRVLAVDRLGAWVIDPASKAP